jgi:hypothetical protein
MIRSRNLSLVWGTLKSMKSIVIILLLVFSGVAFGQPSPALDPDYITLQPKETFRGYYANQVVGGLIKTVAPLRWEVPEGGVFLNDVDTANWNGNLKFDHPTGPFRQNSTFSLFNKADFRIKKLYNPELIFSTNTETLPIMAAALSEPLMFLFPDSSGKYIDTTNYHAYTPKAFLMGAANTGWKSIDVNRDGNDDFFAVELIADSTVIGLWYHDDIVFKGDTLPSGHHIIPAFKEWVLPHPIMNKLGVSDIDNDGVVDLYYLAADKESNFPFPHYFVTIFGKLIDSVRWEVDTVVETIDTHGSIIGYTMMDFLYSDGIPDLLVSVIDSNNMGISIHCLSGDAQNFLRTGVQLNKANLIIPSPATLDTKLFRGNGRGILWEWGERMFDLGNVNGSGEHSLAVLSDYQPDTASLNVITYCFIYSGGKAADEKADALFSDNSTIYVTFRYIDTVNVGGSTLNFLLGDPIYDAGAVGKLNYIEGQTNIPHKPDPRWTKTVKREYIPSDIQLRVPSITTIGSTLKVDIHSTVSIEGIIVLRDILGRECYRSSIANTGRTFLTIELPIRSLPNGTYVIQYEQHGIHVSTKTLCIH